MNGLPEIVFSNTSKELAKKGFKAKRPRYLITLDNLRLVGYPLAADDEDFTEDSFEIINFHMANNFFTKESRRVYTILQQLEKDKTLKVELRFNSYTKEEVVDKRSRNETKRN